MDQVHVIRHKVLVEGRSAREVAVWALAAHGVRCTVARSFSEVYRESLIKNGMLPVVLAPADRPAFEQQVLAVDGRSPFEIDLQALTIACPDGTKIVFEIDASERTALLEGLDDVAITLRHRSLIDAWESRVATHQPWLQQITPPD